MEECRFLSEMKFIINLLYTETVSFLYVFSSDPLFSCIVTFCTLILLYLPHLFWKIVFSPVLILSGILLLLILRLGAIQRSENEEKENTGKFEPIGNEENRANREEKRGKLIEPVEIDSLDQVYRWVRAHSELEVKTQMDFESSSRFEEPFVEWNVKAPLEVIYEVEETEQDPNEKQHMGIFPSLSCYYPETDSENSSGSEFPAMENWDSPEKMSFRWDEEDREGLIEIALDGCKKRTVEFQFEEENLIEIDISPTRHREFAGEDDLFAGEISCD
ncbi:uncharacterized protein LOC113853169 [Abrus precatorius]|uniref:Uncharacterized protein LOC113853169 n=1 Tax=Abrus precatorius TaxID=3816 RepID=A0A8B8K8J0_ABRPR|nr:uncharacterized protein LOC113853169 [Abrus precatorius]